MSDEELIQQLRICRERRETFADEADKLLLFNATEDDMRKFIERVAEAA